jgi:membrane-bound acyltransferase YfiQ involved in biofilm formation
VVTPEMTGTLAVEPAERRLPPIVPLAMASMTLVIVGTIYLAAYLPRTPPLAPAIGLVIGAAILLLTNVVLLLRLRRFAWDRFRVVGLWSLLAYVVIAGMLEYVFVLDGLRGDVLVVMTLLLLIFTFNIPILLAFAVARYKTPDAAR